MNILWDDEASPLEFAFSLALTILLAAFVFVALDFGRLDRRAPLAVGVPAMIMSVVITLSYVSERAHRVMAIFDQTVFAKAGAVADTVEEEVGADEYIENGVRRAIAWLVVLGGLFYLFGSILASFLFMYIYLTVEGDYGKRHSAVVAAGVTAAIWLVFEFFLARSLYDGLVIRTLLGG